MKWSILTTAFYTYSISKLTSIFLKNLKLSIINIDLETLFYYQDWNKIKLKILLIVFTLVMV